MDSEKANRIKKYEMIWGNIVNANFDNEIIVLFLDSVGHEYEDEFIDYMKRKFIRRTIDEWMDIYEREEKINQYNDLKIRELSTEMDSENFLKIKEYQFVETEKGKITLQNLKKFELKYIHPKTQDHQINKLKDKQSKSIYDIFPQFRDLIDLQEKSNTKSENQMVTDKSVIDQDTLIEKFQKECIKRRLVKGKTIPNYILFEIAKEIGIAVVDINEFKTGNKAYHISREFASRLGFKRKKPSER